MKPAREWRLQKLSFAFRNASVAIQEIVDLTVMRRATADPSSRVPTELQPFWSRQQILRPQLDEAVVSQYRFYAQWRMFDYFFPCPAPGKTVTLA